MQQQPIPIVDPDPRLRPNELDHCKTMSVEPDTAAWLIEHLGAPMGVYTRFVAWYAWLVVSPDLRIPFAMQMDAAGRSIIGYPLAHENEFCDALFVLLGQTIAYDIITPVPPKKLARYQLK